LPVAAGKRFTEGTCDVMARLRGGVTAARIGQEQDFETLAFRFLVAIDVEGFSHRGAAEQARAQDDLEYAITQATANAGLDRRRWYRQPSGDGELAVLPEGTDGLSLVSDYPRRLAAAVAAVNQDRRGRQRLRARLAIHHGAVAPGKFGPVGEAPIVISRLVDASALREQLHRDSNLDIALIVSPVVYNEVIQSRLHDLDPDAFSRTSMRAKGISYVGYFWEETIQRNSVVSEIQRQPMPA
jgi:hypothetical protein